jgi:hypothetical protein
MPDALTPPPSMPTTEPAQHQRFILPYKFWDYIRPAWEREFGEMPQPGEAVIAVETVTDASGQTRITGFASLVHVLFVGPSLTYPEYREQGVLRRLGKFLDDNMLPGARVFTVTELEHVQETAEEFGMEHIEGALLRKDF